MSNLSTPKTIDASPTASQPLLEAIKKQLGLVPNMYRLIGNSPAALEAYLGLSHGLDKGEIDLQTRERIALTVAKLNQCDYCLSAHTYVGKNLAKLDDAELVANRRGTSSDPKAAAALRFASRVVEERGGVSPGDVKAVKLAGFTDSQVIEIVLHVALNTLTNYVNKVGETEIDFPQVSHKAA